MGGSWLVCPEGGTGLGWVFHGGVGLGKGSWGSLQASHAPIGLGVPLRVMPIWERAEGHLGEVYKPAKPLALFRRKSRSPQVLSV